MKFQSPVLEGILLRRYKRFLADVKLIDTGETVVAHVPNSGSMLGVSDPGSPCRVTLSSNPERKLKHTLEMVRVSSGEWVGVNTALTNHLVGEAFSLKLIKDWKRYDTIRSEVKINAATRLDFVLSGRHGLRYVEVKNVSMARPPLAVFPDARTERGQKHLNELMKLAGEGHAAEVFFVVQRRDCHVFSPCDEIDPEYGRLLRKASDRGVDVRCWACKLDESEIVVERELDVDLG